MKKSFAFRLIAFVISLQSISPIAYSQVIEVDAAVGYGAVKVEKWTGISENGITFRLSDWSNFSGYASLNALFPVSNSIHLGVSAGYQHLFWYEFKYFDIDGIYRSTYHRDVNASRFLGLARFNFGSNFIDLGVGGFVVKDVDENYTSPATFLSFGHAFKLAENLFLPLKLSSSVIIEDNPIIPITLGAGLSYRIK